MWDRRRRRPRGCSRRSASRWRGCLRSPAPWCAPLLGCASILSPGPIRSRAMTASDDVVSVERVIPAPPEKIFDLLADPSRHREIDGSGTVRDAKSGSERLGLGSTFGMAMKMGVPYSMTNEVIDFEENRRIAWQTKPPVSWGAKLGGGRIWRYDLEPVDGGTRVRETWDISQEAALSKPLVVRGGKKTAEHMDKTLARIEQIVTA